MTRRHLLMSGMAAFVLLRGVWFSMVIPPWQGPDEPMHFVLAVSSLHRAMDDSERVVMESAVIQSMARNRFWEFTGQVEPNPLPSIIRTSSNIPAPTLYHYLLGGWFWATGLPLHGTSWSAAALPGLVSAGRLFSVLLSCAAVIVLWGAARALFRSSAFASLVTMLFIAHPQMAFIGSCLNSDNLLVFLSVLAAYLLARAVVGRSRRALLPLLTVCLLAPLAKRAGLALSLTILPTLALLMIGTRRRLAVLAGFVVVLAMVGAGLWFLGMARSMTRDILEVLGIGGWVTEQPAGWWRNFLAHFWSTFWGTYGWVQCPLPLSWLRGIAVLVATSLIMVPVGLRRIPHRGRSVVVIGVLAAQLVLALLQVATVQGIRMELGQGRHAFVGLPGLVMLVAIGIRGAIPARWGSWSLAVVGMAAVLLSEMAIWFIALPCFLR